jgi:CheY-like chemotaxis protein
LVLRLFFVFLLLVLGPWSFGLGGPFTAVSAAPASHGAHLIDDETRRGPRRRESSQRSPNSAAKIVIVDDHELARAGIRCVLEGEPDLAVVGEAASGHEAIAVCRSVHPQLVLMDVRMPGMDRIATTRYLSQELPSIRVIMLTVTEDPDHLRQARSAGAAGYLLKDASQEQIVTAIRRVLQGETLFA